MGTEIIKILREKPWLPLLLQQMGILLPNSIRVSAVGKSDMWKTYYPDKIRALVFFQQKPGDNMRGEELVLWHGPFKDRFIEQFGLFVRHALDRLGDIHHMIVGILDKDGHELQLLERFQQPDETWESLTAEYANK